MRHLNRISWRKNYAWPRFVISIEEITLQHSFPAGIPKGNSRFPASKKATS